MGTRAPPSKETSRQDESAPSSLLRTSDVDPASVCSWTKLSCDSSARSGVLSNGAGGGGSEDATNTDGLEGSRESRPDPGKGRFAGASFSTTLGWSMGRLGELRGMGEEQDKTGDCFMGEAAKEHG